MAAGKLEFNTLPEKRSFSGRGLTVLSVAAMMIVAVFLLVFHPLSALASTWSPGDVFVGGGNGYIRVFDHDGIYKNEQLYNLYGGGITA